MKLYIPITNDEDERECIGNARIGDKDSYGRLVEKYEEKLKEYCEKQLHCNSDNAEDLTAEVFRKAWESIRLYESRNDATFLTWLKKIGCNHYFNQREKEKREASIILRMKTACDSIFNLGKGSAKKEQDDQDTPIEKVEKDNAVMKDFLNRRPTKGQYQIAADVEENDRSIATKDCVQRQLDKIRPEYREVINLVHLQDKSYKDAAEELNWDQEQVRKRLNRALKEAGPFLRECL